MLPIITLTTDFGTSDPYVAIMKGVILGIAPEVRLIDVTHEVPPQDVFAAAVVLESAVSFFPRGTIHLAVVDPGVGSNRKAVAIETEAGHFLVGPDNGIFSAVLERDPPVEAVCLDREEYHRTPVSRTFHGRDIFAPAAGHLARGVAIGKLGSTLDELTRMQMPGPIARGNHLQLHVLAIDRYGNIITDLTREAFESWRGGTPPQRIGIRLRGAEIHGLATTYGDVPGAQPVAYFGSTDRLEIAVSQGSASAVFQLDIGEIIQVFKLNHVTDDATNGRAVTATPD